MNNSDEISKEVYKKGEVIFFEGDIDYHFYIIEQGKVGIFKKGANGQRIDISVVDEGESFGEFALLDKQARSASAEALADCILVKVSEKGYEKLLSELPTWASCMLTSFAQRMKNMNKMLASMPQFIEKK